MVNLLILYLLLKKFLFKPVTDFMENRTNSIQNDINTAKSKIAEAESIKKQYEEKLEAAYKEAEKIIAESKKKAEDEYERIIMQARKDAEEIMNKAYKAIEAERANILKNIRNEIITLAFAAASKILQKNMNTEENKRIVENFLNEEGVA